MKTPCILEDYNVPIPFLVLKWVEDCTENYLKPLIQYFAYNWGNIPILMSFFYSVSFFFLFPLPSCFQSHFLILFFFFFPFYSPNLCPGLPPFVTYLLSTSMLRNGYLKRKWDNDTIDLTHSWGSSQLSVEL